MARKPNAIKLTPKEAQKLLEEIGTGAEPIIPRHAQKQVPEKAPKAKKVPRKKK
jgi:hypothetical protein